VQVLLDGDFGGSRVQAPVGQNPFAGGEGAAAEKIVVGAELLDALAREVVGLDEALRVIHEADAGVEIHLEVRTLEPVRAAVEHHVAVRNDFPGQLVVDHAIGGQAHVAMANRDRALAGHDTLLVAALEALGRYENLVALDGGNGSPRCLRFGSVA
jgi:hypothetical protein